MAVVILIMLNFISYFIGYAKGIKKGMERQEAIDKLVDVYRIMEKRKKENNVTEEQLFDLGE